METIELSTLKGAFQLGTGTAPVRVPLSEKALVGKMLTYKGRELQCVCREWSMALIGFFTAPQQVYGGIVWQNPAPPKEHDAFEGWALDQTSHATALTGRPVYVLSAGGVTYRLVPTHCRGVLYYHAEVSYLSVTASLTEWGTEVASPVLFNNREQARAAVEAHRNPKRSRRR